jgi:hypothetical protein
MIDVVRRDRAITPTVVARPIGPSRSDTMIPAA